MKKEKKLADKKVFLKQKRPHKIGFRLGRHLITLGPAKEYILNHKEQKELEGAGPKAWIQVVTQKQMDAAPKSNAENKKIQLLKKELLEMGVELKGDESLSDLEEIKEVEKMIAALRKALDDKGVQYTGKESVEELEEMLG